MNKLFDMDREQLRALAEYREVLETGRFFPRNFWQNEKNTNGIRLNCQAITRYCLEGIEGISANELPSRNLKQIKEILSKNRLMGMLQTVFHNDVLKVLINAYPEKFKKRELTEWMWSSHGIWNNDGFVIEAVQYMVLKEGIRRVELIPKTDWKKRLLKYGIYNILSRFNWSLFHMFDFVYPGRFHPADFKYKVKWKTSIDKYSRENAWRFMDKTFKEKQLSRESILLLNSTGFRRLGLISMLLNVFGGSPLKAKEYYFYRTIGNKENEQCLADEMKKAGIQRENEKIRARFAEVSTGKYIYNLHANMSAYSFFKRQANKRNLKIHELAEQFGYIYKSAVPQGIDPNQIWALRKEGLTYIEIAEKLDSNPTTISELCKKHFGGDPLIPRPISNYSTVQELMNQYHMDHKTIMKLVTENHLENHTTIRHRYLKKSEIITVIEQYKKNSLHHRALLNRYVDRQYCG